MEVQAQPGSGFKWDRGEFTVRRQLNRNRRGSRLALKCSHHNVENIQMIFDYRNPIRLI